MAGLVPSVVDVQISTLSQTPPDHAGPVGRLVEMKNAEVVHYLPPQAGGAGGGASPQAVLVQQREGFVSLDGDVRQSSDGSQQFGGMKPAELLATLGDQLLSIQNSVPFVYNGTDFTTYRDGDTVDVRALTGKLSQDILHTSNKTIQASDSAVIGGVTCFVWTETNEGFTTSFVGFKGSDGAWIVTPRALFAASSASDVALVKTVSDGTQFWVIFNNASANLQIHVYDTHGAQLATATKTRRWTTSPGFWDIVRDTVGAVLLAQPASYAPGTDVHVEFTKLFYSSGVVQSSHTDTAIHCMGPVAWLSNEAGLSPGFSYLATVALGTESTRAVLAYEVDEPTITSVHEFIVADLLSNALTIDAMTGYVRAGSGIEVVVAWTSLSEFSPSSGPPNDPGLRTIRVVNCSRSNSTVLIKQANGVALQSRAFQVATSPAEAPDFYAVTYYQSGGGLLPGQTAQTITVEEGDQMTGAEDQPVQVVAGDGTTGASHTILSAGSIFYATNSAFYASSWSPVVGTDSVNGDTGVCEFTTADFGVEFVNTPVGSYLRIAGSAVPTNNQDYLILDRDPNGTHHLIRIEVVGNNGDQWLPDDLTGVTASIVSTVALWIPEATNGAPVPAGLIGQFTGGTFVIAGASNAANDGTYTIKRLLVHAAFTSGSPISSIGAPFSVFIANKPGSQTLEAFTGTASISPVSPFAWIFSQRSFSSVDVGNLLVVEGAQNPGNNSSAGFPISSTLTNVVFTDGETGQVPEVFGVPLPTVNIHLADGIIPLTFTFAGFTFDDSYNGAFITVADAIHPENDGVYQITHVRSAHVIECVSATGATGQINEAFGSPVVTVTRSTGNSPNYQPCWFLTPLSVAQPIAGRFEYGIAYADWRFDGATTDVAVGTDFNRNHFPFALSSMTPAPAGVSADRAVVLPYRAQSFTAGQVVRTGPNVVGIASVQESTVGLKRFTLAGANFGQALTSSGEMLLPGPLGGAFTASGFHEDGVSLGFEQPFIVSQSDTADIIGLTLGATYQYVVVGEVMDENGDRTFAIPSPALTVTLTGTNNTIVIGGRTVGPTNRPLIGISIYRTAVQGGTPTVQHYKITDDLDVNGTGFQLSKVTGGTLDDTWQFTDTQPDAAILSQEIMYTDKGQTPRFPAPAFAQGVGSWCNRAWVVGYDGAVWMSGEKTEGDALWFTPLFRYTLPTDDKPVAVAALDEFLLVFCTRSIWYIPKTDFPSATLASGSLPTPVQLPYQNGCTGLAITIRSGVAYASTAGGVWLLTRQLTNVWISQDVQTDMTGTVTSLLVDERQRFIVLNNSASIFVFDQVAQCWSTWILPTAAALACNWTGRATYQNKLTPSSVAVHTAGVFADTIAGSTTAIPPDITLAGVSLAGVRSYKRCWAIQIVGQYMGPHHLNAVISYPDEDDMAPTTYGPIDVDPAAPYVYEINPDPEEASTFGLRLFADFDGIETPGNSFTLELISFEIGVERGINRLPSSKRQPSNG